MFETTALSFEDMAKIADKIRDKIGESCKPKIGIILGSGYGPVADAIQNPVCIPYGDLKGFPVSTVAGHKGRFVIGQLEGKCVVCMQGRYHPYEGHSMGQCTIPVRVMFHLGVKTLLVTNAAGGLNPDFNIGDLMIISDHIFFPGFSGNNPLRGLNDDRYGPRFPSLINLYDREYRQIAKQVAHDLGMSNEIREGIYAMNGGPSYETVAEIRMCRALEASAIGMSTCHESIVARHCGMRVFGLSMITNKCTHDPDATINVCHKEVLDVGAERAPVAAKLLQGIIQRISVE